MDLPQQNTIVQYTADGTTDTYDFAYYVPEAADIQVYVTPSGQEPVPASDIKILNTDYTVSFSANPIDGGTVTFLTGKIPANGATITLSRWVEASIEVDFADARNINGANLDEAFERNMLVSQQNQTYSLYRNLSYIINSDLPPNPSDITAYTQLPVLQNGYIWKGLANGITSVFLEENPDVGTLRSELENSSPNTDGARIVGYYDTINLVQTTVRDAINSLQNEIASFVSDNVLAKTGDIKHTINPTPPTGWIALNDETIGNTGSNATNRANADTEALYTLLWNNFPNNKAIIYTSFGVPTTRGASAADDFAANKQIRFPYNEGRVFGNIGSTTSTYQFSANSTTDLITITDDGQANESLYTGKLVRFQTTGDLPSPLVAGEDYYIIRESTSTYKLAVSYSNSLAGTAIDITTNGTGINTLILYYGVGRDPGMFVGEDTHYQLVSELVSHQHNCPSGSGFLTHGSGDDGTAVGSDVIYAGESVTATGGNEGFNVVQPSVYWTTIIKL